MNISFKQAADKIVKTVTQIHFIPVRYRYHADKIKRGPYSKKFGYEEKIFTRGVLPRLKTDKALPMPVYRPANAWSHTKVVHGQNDYIDLLGGGKLHPHSVSYEVPKWLRKQEGNEMKLLIIKRNRLLSTRFGNENPTVISNMGRRIMYLYRFLNRKTKTGFSSRQ